MDLRTTFPVCSISALAASSAARQRIARRSGPTVMSIAIVVACVLIFVVPAPVSADYVAEVTADNPVSWWRFEDASSASGSTAADSAGVFNGTYTGDIELVEGVAGQSARLDGSFDYIDVGAMGALPTEGSIELWMRPEAVESYRNPFTTGPTDDPNTGNHAIRFEETDSGLFRVVVGDESGSVYDYMGTVTPDLTAGKWYHLVVTWDTTLGRISVYLDGDVVIDDDANAYWPTQLSDVTIGVGYYLESTRCWLGNIDEVAIYDSRLSARQVWAHFDAVTNGEQKLWASDAYGWDVFGSASAIDGNTAIVGAYGADDSGPPVVLSAGAAYVFERDDSAGAWLETIKLTGSDAAEDDYFGYDVAISGDIAVVGAIRNDQGATNAGAAFVFYRGQGGPGAWGEVAKLVASDAGEDDWFGISVGVDGSTVVVGAAKADGVGTDSGKAYVFEQNAGGPDNWGQVKILTASDAAAGARFGCGAGISGDTVVIGAYGDPAGGADTGAAYVFDRDQGGVGQWGQVAKLTASDAAAGARFGLNVSIDGDLAVAGAYLDSGAATEAGAAYVFERDHGGPDAWGERAKLVPSDVTAEDYAGYDVGIHGDFVVVGAGYHDADPLRREDTGAAYVFSRNTDGIDGWGEYLKLIASDSKAEDHFGHAKGIAVGHGWLVVGASRVDGGTPTTPECGAAYVYLMPLFVDGFESGTTDGWSTVHP